MNIFSKIKTLDEQRTLNLLLYYLFLKEKPVLNDSEEKELENIEKKYENSFVEKYKQKLKNTDYYEEGKVTDIGKIYLENIKSEVRDENKNGITYSSYLTVFVVILFIGLISSQIITGKLKIIACSLSFLGVISSLLGTHLYWHGSSHEHNYSEYLRLNRKGDGLMSLALILAVAQVVCVFSSIFSNIVLLTFLMGFVILIIGATIYNVGKVGGRTLVEDIIFDLLELLPCKIKPKSKKTDD